MNNYVPEDPDLRSPSPEPIYNNEGKRINTREVRKRDAFVRERISLIEDCMKMRKTYTLFHVGSSPLRITSRLRSSRRSSSLITQSTTPRPITSAKSSDPQEGNKNS